jgi:putative membrane protein
VRSPLDYALLCLKGMAMGAADVVPGVSGGTIAFITGIYEELLNTINSVNLSLLTTLLKQGLKAAWKQVNGGFLLVLLTGIAISVISLAKVFSWLLKEHPDLLWSFFFGLVAASIWMVIKQVKKKTIGGIAAFIIGAAAAYLVTEIPVSDGPKEYWFIFVSGVLAICAMILPGISGSFILLLLGMYEFVLDAVNNRDLAVLGILAAGSAVGLLSFARVLSFLFKRFHDLTVMAMAGFLLGSLNEIWPWKETVSTRQNSKGEAVPFEQNNILPQMDDIWAAGGLMLAGAALLIILERFAPKKA